MNHRKLSLVLLATLVLGGCVAQWTKVTNLNNKITQSGMTVELPVGWVGLAVNKKLQVASKDGMGLNALVVETLPFSDIQKSLDIKIDSNMDMLEASKKYLAYWSKQHNITDFDVAVEDYVELAGKGHFYIEWTYKDSNGTTMRNATQGTVKSASIVNVLFAAPNIYYYEKNISIVKDIMASVKHA